MKWPIVLKSFAVAIASTLVTGIIASWSVGCSARTGCDTCSPVYTTLAFTGILMFTLTFLFSVLIFGTYKKKKD